jgi:hypothetical protein
MPARSPVGDPPTCFSFAPATEFFDAAQTLETGSSGPLLLGGRTGADFPADGAMLAGTMPTDRNW